MFPISIMCSLFLNLYHFFPVVPLHTFLINNFHHLHLFMLIDGLKMYELRDFQ